MPELHPHGLRRMLSLRQFRLFENAELDELAMIAENVFDTTIPAGTVIASPGSRLRGVHLILRGSIKAHPSGQTWGPRSAFGALEVFANRECRHSAIAATDLQTLHICASDIGEILEDNFTVLLATLRELASRVASFGHGWACAPIPTTPANPLGLVERLILLRQQLPFTSARLQALAALADASDEMMWPAHSVVTREGELATCGFVIIDGSVIATRAGTTQRLERGAPIAHLETLAGLPHSTTINTTSPVRVLRSQAAAILDVLEDHTDVALAMLATFAGALLDGATHLN
jgi:CRP-like cAMP-binding protein